MRGADNKTVCVTGCRSVRHGLDQATIAAPLQKPVYAADFQDMQDCLVHRICRQMSGLLYAPSSPLEATQAVSALTCLQKCLGQETNRLAGGVFGQH